MVTHSALRATRSDEDMADSMSKHFRSALGISDKHIDDTGWACGRLGRRPLCALHNASKANVSERLVRENRRTSALRRHLQKPTSEFLAGSPFFFLVRKEGGLHARPADNEDFGTRPSRLLGGASTTYGSGGLQKVNRKLFCNVATVRLHKRFDESWFLTQQSDLAAFLNEARNGMLLPIR